VKKVFKASISGFSMVRYSNDPNSKFRKLMDKRRELRELDREHDAINASFHFSKHSTKVSSMSSSVKDSYLAGLEAEVQGIPAKVHLKGADATSNEYHGTPDVDNYVPNLY
jgi:hypothetical protein